jgi:polyketide cyclase/dehydrase/lipid transport protein
MPNVATTVSIRIPSAREPLFDWFIPIELPRILTGWGPVPAVVATSEQSGPWDTPGSRRTVHLADGSTAHERVTACERPASFGYTVNGFSGPVRYVAVEGRGQWWFEAAGPGATDVRWTYTFQARSRAAALLLTPVVKVAWRGFMRRGLDRLAALARDEVR